MCFDLDSVPPIPVIRGAAVSHADLVLEAATGTPFAAFAALPDEPRRAGVVILPDTIGPDDVAAFEEALEQVGVEHEVVTYPGTPHSFFDRRYAGESEDAWGRVLAFVERHS